MRCRKSELFSEEEQTLPNPVRLAEILKQPWRGKQRENVSAVCRPAGRQALSLSFLGNTEEAFSSQTRASESPIFPPSKNPSSLSESPLGEIKTNTA